MIEHNPITRIRQGGYRRSDPDILTPVEFQALPKELSAEGVSKLDLKPEDAKVKEFTFDYTRTMVILAVCLGLSISEFTGLKWGDFDWKNAVLTIQRGMVNNHVGKPKTLPRRKPVPFGVGSSCRSRRVAN